MNAGRGAAIMAGSLVLVGDEGQQAPHLAYLDLVDQVPIRGHVVVAIELELDLEYLGEGEAVGPGLLCDVHNVVSVGRWTVVPTCHTWYRARSESTAEKPGRCGPGFNVASAFALSLGEHVAELIVG